MEFRINQPHSTRHGGGFVAGLIFIISGIVILNISSFVFKDMEETLQWPSVPGIITVSEVIASQGRNSDGKEVTNYWANVSAQYEVNGFTQMSDSITPVQMTTSTMRSVIKKDTNAYPVGAEVLVYYNPEDPGYGILEPGIPSLMKLLKIIPWLAVAFGITLLGKRILMIFRAG